jgi:arylsulfatase
VELSGASYPAGGEVLPMEGRSLVPAFQGHSLDRDYLAWEHEGNRAIRMGDMKLVALKDQPWELYDISKDRVELNNLASQQPERVKTMAEKWQQWAERCHVLMK